MNTDLGPAVLESIREAIRTLVLSPQYPCVPAILSLQKQQYLIGVYDRFGEGAAADRLHRDLAAFQDRQRSSDAPWLSYWAVFLDRRDFSEEQFENALWSELSALSAAEPPPVAWDPRFSSNPADPKFCFSLGGEAFFVVGLHRHSHRKARQFPWPTLIFNRYEQFEELSRQGRYEAIVQKNRAREMKFQGSLNPMVEKHADQWEAIQFSGKENPDDWKCPFHRGGSGR